MAESPGLLIVGHGSRSRTGIAECWDLASLVTERAPGVEVGCGFIELARPDLDTAVDALVARGVTSVTATPLLLLGAGHLKNDGPAALHRARHRHASVRFRYARDLGIHPLVLAVAEDRIRTAIGDDDPTRWAIVVVGRGSSDPDANADLAKVCRLLWDSRGLGMVEPAFVSLAPPDVPTALERCRRLGAERVAVVPYFLFTGVLVERIYHHAAAWAANHPAVEVRAGPHLGPDERVARLLLERHDEALNGDVRMNCDLCVYRTALPGYEDRVGAVRPPRHDHDHVVPVGGIPFGTEGR